MPASGGTFFLDEVGDMPITTQSKLLRVLQEREIIPVGTTQSINIDIRLITATNKDLGSLIKQNKFREDLYYRLNVVPIHVPPLRERVEDIPILIEHFFKKIIHERKLETKVFSNESIEIFKEYEWPGNIRELQNVIERLLIMTDEDIIKPEHLPANILRYKTKTVIDIPRNNDELKEIKRKAKKNVIQNIEKSFVINALKKNDWNISKTSNDVGMKRQNFQILMKKYQIDRNN